MHTRIIILLPQFTKYFSAQKNLFSPKLSNEADVVKLLKTGLWGKKQENIWIRSVWCSEENRVYKCNYLSLPR